jgi:hypothetical protein
MVLKRLNPKTLRLSPFWARWRRRLGHNAAIWLLACLTAISLILLIYTLAPAR